ncbi:MFS transporter [Microbacterium karelineae]|uniref:MFS transporter n=1 Tax=Microbacterium karelineae TaxID=2654283 RepID=UPI001E3CFF45|nr:MFS transporter [Microbacterium karelineae]
MKPNSDPALRRAHIAAATFFFVNGAVFANLVPRYPELKDQLDMSATVYGIVIAMNPVGAMLAGVAAAALIRRFGSARVAAFTSVGLALGTLAAAAAPSILLLAGAFLLAGAMDAISDVAQNANALRVQERRGKTIINSMHAIWSAGAVTGGALAAGAIALDLPLTLHLAISSVCLGAVSVLALRWALPGPDSEVGRTEEIRVAREAGGVTPKVVLIVIALLLVAIGGGLVEEVGFSWVALYLRGEIGAPAQLAAAGFVGLVSAQFIGRMVSDRLVDRFGARLVVTTAGILIVCGIGLAMSATNVWAACAGFALAGFGCAPTIPLAMQEADRLPGLRPGVGLTIVTWLMRLAFLFAPPLVGSIADASSLRAGLTVSLVGGVVVLVLAFVMPSRDPHRRS